MSDFSQSNLSQSVCLLFFFFFFQAEDGIRDTSVTGVQTCALPILQALDEEGDRMADGLHGLLERAHVETGRLGRGHQRGLARDVLALDDVARSEERRVGKECRCGWWGEESKKEERTGRGGHGRLHL